MLSRQFQHVETEILQMSESCHQSEAALKIVFESAYLAEDLKNILCKMAKRTDADFIESDNAADLAQLMDEFLTTCTGRDKVLEERLAA